MDHTACGKVHIYIKFELLDIIKTDGGTRADIILYDSFFTSPFSIQESYQAQISQNIVLMDRKIPMFQRCQMTNLLDVILAEANVMLGLLRLRHPHIV